jgi:hypothetical protein
MKIEDMDEMVREITKNGTAAEMRLLLNCMMDMMQGVSTSCADEKDQEVANLGMALATWKRSIV